jgi:hypothetical protein
MKKTRKIKKTKTKNKNEIKINKIIAKKNEK